MASPEWLGTTTAFATASNWSTGSTPIDTDTAIFNQRATGGIAGSDQSTIELTALEIDSSYVYYVGDNLSPLIIDATTVNIGKVSGSSTAGAGSGRINLSLPDVASTINIFGTKNSSTDTAKEPVRIKTGANANKLFMFGSGRVGIARDGVTDTAQFSEISCLSAGATILVGAGTTLTKWRQTGGVGYLYGALTTLQQDSGTVYTYGAGAITTVHCSGTAYLSSSGTVTTLNINEGGTVDMTQSAVARTFTTINMYKGATLTYDPNIITVTNPINVIGCNIEDVTINTPNGVTVAIVKS